MNKLASLVAAGAIVLSSSVAFSAPVVKADTQDLTVSTQSVGVGAAGSLAGVTAAQLTAIAVFVVFAGVALSDSGSH